MELVVKIIDLGSASSIAAGPADIRSGQTPE
jgi:hypothetical protein